MRGKRIGYNNTTCTPQPCTLSTQQAANLAAVNALAAAGAIMVPDASTTVASLASLPSGWEAHATIDEYYKGLGPNVPIKSLADEVAYDNTNPQEAEKDGNSAHANESTSDDTTITNPFAPTSLGLTNANQFATNLVLRKARLPLGAGRDDELPGRRRDDQHHDAAGLANGTTTCPDGSVNPVIAIIGSAPSTPQAGYPEMVVPMGYTTTQRRNIGVDVFAGAYGERDIIGVGYVIEQATKLRKPVGEIDPASYRCAHTTPAEPYAARGHCNPDYPSVMAMLGGQQTILPFPLETTSAQAWQAKMAAGTLTSEQLVKAELTRIALANANGPAVQAVRATQRDALSDAKASDARRAAGGARGPARGHPGARRRHDRRRLAGHERRLDRAARTTCASGDAALVSKLKAAGAVILGDTNVTELERRDGRIGRDAAGLLVAGRPGAAAGRHQQDVGGSSAGSPAAVVRRASPRSPWAWRPRTDTAQLITPAGNDGVVAIKPTVGTVSHAGVLPVATSQDAPGRDRPDRVRRGGGAGRAGGARTTRPASRRPR